MLEPSTESPEFAGQCLLRLATLSAALTGGGIFLMTDWTLGMLFRVATGLCLVAFGIATTGLSQRSSDAAAKWRRFNASAAILFAALATALAGTVWR